MSIYEIGSLGHYPVFYREVIDFARDTLTDDALFVDCTVGSGGHSSFVLEQFPDARVIGFERDERMAERAKKNLAHFGERFSLINDNFSKFSFYFAGMEEQISAILYDYGISSYHLDGDERGFAIKERDSRLDMRLDSGCEHSAYEIVNEFPEKDIADIIYQYGEERLSRRIARYICKRREESEIATTGELADIVMRAKPRPKGRRSRVHPATKVFQALRIYINGELSAIEESLEESWKFLKPGGRIIAITFHSLEDRIVKRCFKSLSKGCSCEDPTFCSCDRIPKVKILNKKVIVPSEEEMNENPRSRSAKLRVCERI